MRNVLLTAITAGIVFLSGVAMISKKTTLKNNKKKYIDQPVKSGEIQKTTESKQHTTKVEKDRQTMDKTKPSIKVAMPKAKDAIKEKLTLKRKLLITKEKWLVAMKHLVACSRQVLSPVWNVQLLGTVLLHIPLHKRMQPALVSHQGTTKVYIPIGARRFEVIQGGKRLEQPTKNKKCLYKIREPSNQGKVYGLREFTIYKGG